MPKGFNPYVDSDMIKALYQDPGNEVLLVEYALATGGIQMGITQQGIPDGNLAATEIQGRTGPPPGECFIGETLVRLFNGRRVSLEYMFNHREEFLGKGVRAFDKANQIWPGKILDIRRTMVSSIWEVSFAGEKPPMGMIKEHRFWTPGREFISMKDLMLGEAVSGYDGNWKDIIIESQVPRTFSYGVYVYNLTIANFHSYMVAALGEEVTDKAVSNNKPPAEDPQA